MAKGSICRNCFHSYVCEQFNEKKDENNKKCHFLNDHYVPIADVVPKSEVDKLEIEIEALKIANEKMYEAFKRQAREIFEEIEKQIGFYRMCMHIDRGVKGIVNVLDELKKKYTESEDKG